MRALIQRVERARVTVEKETIGKIENGYVIFQLATTTPRLMRKNYGVKFLVCASLTTRTVKPI